MISIIIPAYNEEKHIGQCLDSIFNLDYPRDKFEVIVIDNGSSDRTREIAASYDILLLQDSTKNVSGLRNLGARHAKGEILAFVDADCVVARNWLKQAEKYFNDFLVVVWGAPPIPPENSTWVQAAWFLVRKKNKVIEEVDWLESMNLFVRKDLFDKVGGFDESLITCEDVDLSYRLSKFGKIISDSRLKVIHLGEAATVREFFKKELWRGKGNFKGVLRHGLSLKEIPSLIIPLYFGVVIPFAFIFSLVIQSIIFFILSVVLFLIPGIMVLQRIRQKHSDIIKLSRFFFLLYVYFIARTVSLFLGNKLKSLGKEVTNLLE